MIAFGLAYAWCIFQVTLLSGAVIALYFSTGRTRPVFRSYVVSTGLALVLALSLLMLSPWPRWTGSSEAHEAPAASVAGLAEVEGARSVRVDDRLGANPAAGAHAPQSGEGARPVAPGAGAPQELPAALVNDPVAGDEEAAPKELSPPGSRLGEGATGTTGSTGATTLGQFWGRFPVFSRTLRRLQRPDASLQGWLRLMAIGLIVGMSFGVCRLLHGWLSLRNFRTETLPVIDRRLAESLDISQAALGCVTPIELRESRSLTSAATVGWFRPIIMLPSDWRDWSDDECLGVIAHEVAHVRRGDFLSWCLAQLVLVLHFYHPFVNWLVSWLRLEQELAADAAAAGVVGSHKTYLRMLASMASREAEKSPNRSARTFLPTHGTLVARLEMLRSQRLVASPGSSPLRAAVFSALALVGMIAAGFRADLALGGGAAAAFASADGNLTLDYVPRSAPLVLAARPERFLETQLLAELGVGSGDSSLFDVPLERIAQVSIFVMPHGGERELPEPHFAGMVIRTRSAVDSRRILEKATGRDHLTDAEVRSPVTPEPEGAYLGLQPDDATVLVCRRQDDLLAALDAGVESDDPDSRRSTEWDECGGADLKIYADVNRLRSLLRQLPALPPELSGVISQLEPAWRAAETMALGWTVQPDLELQFKLWTADSRSLPVADLAIGAGIAAARWELSNAITQLNHSGERGAAEWHDALKWVRVIVDGLESSSESERAVSVKASIPYPSLTESTAGRVDAWPRLTRLLVGERNRLALLQIRTALKRYRMKHGDFPPVEVVKEEGQPPHSWRVAILPELGYEDLYRRYQFHLPWSSPENLELIPEMPPCFGDVMDPPGSPFTNTIRIATSRGEPVPLNWLDQDDSSDDSLLLILTRRISLPWTSPHDTLLPVDQELLSRQFIPSSGCHALAIDDDGDIRYRFLSSPAETLE